MPIGNTDLVRSIVLGVALLGGGCDAVFGLSGDPGPCASTSFAHATGTEITVADDFSISRDRSLVVLARDGLTYQLALPGGDPMLVDLGVYPAQSLAMAPEGNALFFTAPLEPPLLLGALRAGEGWTLDATVPRGTFVGTPSASEFGPRRLMARLRPGAPEIQELEAVAGVRTQHGEPLELGGNYAPNLTPDGLSMVYVANDPDTGVPGAVFLASRASLADGFTNSVLILPGAHHAPHMLDVCRELYVVDDDQVLRRYDRP